MLNISKEDLQFFNKQISQQLENQCKIQNHSDIINVQINLMEGIKIKVSLDLNQSILFNINCIIEKISNSFPEIKISRNQLERILLDNISIHEQNLLSIKNKKNKLQLLRKENSEKRINYNSLSEEKRNSTKGMVLNNSKLKNKQVIENFNSQEKNSNKNFNKYETRLYDNRKNIKNLRKTLIEMKFQFSEINDNIEEEKDIQSQIDKISNKSVKNKRLSKLNISSSNISECDDKKLNKRTSKVKKFKRKYKLRYINKRQKEICFNYHIKFLSNKINYHNRNNNLNEKILSYKNNPILTLLPSFENICIKRISKSKIKSKKQFKYIKDCCIQREISFFYLPLYYNRKDNRKSEEGQTFILYDNSTNYLGRRNRFGTKKLYNNHLGVKNILKQSESIRELEESDRNNNPEKRMSSLSIFTIEKGKKNNKIHKDKDFHQTNERKLTNGTYSNINKKEINKDRDSLEPILNKSNFPSGIGILKNSPITDKSSKGKKYRNGSQNNSHGKLILKGISNSCQKKVSIGKNRNYINDDNIISNRSKNSNIDSSKFSIISSQEKSIQCLGIKSKNSLNKLIEINNNLNNNNIAKTENIITNLNISNQNINENNINNINQKLSTFSNINQSKTSNIDNKNSILKIVKEENQKNQIINTSNIVTNINLNLSNTYLPLFIMKNSGNKKEKKRKNSTSIIKSLSSKKIKSRKKLIKLMKNNEKQESLKNKNLNMEYINKLYSSKKIIKNNSEKIFFDDQVNINKLSNKNKKTENKIYFSQYSQFNKNLNKIKSLKDSKVNLSTQSLSYNNTFTMNNISTNADNNDKHIKYAYNKVNSYIDNYWKNTLNNLYNYYEKKYKESQGKIEIKNTIVNKILFNLQSKNKEINIDNFLEEGRKHLII